MSFLSSIGVDPAEIVARGEPIEMHVPGKISEGFRYSDGDVQRHILRLQGGFEDSWRICGDFVCVLVSPVKLEASQYTINPSDVDEYACLIRKGSLPPPIVVDYDGDFIDGGHRHAAAIEAGLDSLLALVQVEDLQESPDEDED